MSSIRFRLKSILSGSGRQVLLSALIMPIGLGLMFLMYLILGRNLSVAEFGKFTFVIQLASMGAIVLSGGLPVSAQKFIPYYSALNDMSRLHAFLTWSVIWITILVLMLMAASIVLVLNSVNSTALLVVVSMIPVTIWLWQRYTALGHDRIKLALAPRDIIVSILAILVFLSIDLQNGVQALLIYNLVFTVVTLFAAFLLADHRYFAIRVLQKNRSDAAAWHRTAVPMAFTAITQLGFNGFDVVLLGFLSNMKETGIYSAALRLALLIALITRVLNIALGQKFSAYFARQQYNHIKLLYRKATLLSIFVGSTIFVIVAAAPTKLLAIFGSDYSEGAVILVILAAGQLSSCFFGPIGMIHNMLGNHDFAAKSQALWLTLAIIINVLLIPLYGALGAAIVTSSGLWLMRFHQWIYFNRQLKLLC